GFPETVEIHVEGVGEKDDLPRVGSQALDDPVAHERVLHKDGLTEGVSAGGAVEVCVAYHENIVAAVGGKREGHPRLNGRRMTGAVSGDHEAALQMLDPVGTNSAHQGRYISRKRNLADSEVGILGLGDEWVVVAAMRVDKDTVASPAQGQDLAPDE